MLINDKSQLKRNVEQIGYQLELKTSARNELHKYLIHRKTGVKQLTET